MTKWGGKFTAVMLAIVFVGCGLAGKRGLDPAEKELREHQEQALSEALEPAGRHDWTVAEEKLREFLKDHPVSVYRVEANYHLGRTLEEQNRFEDALTLYRELVHEAMRNQKEFAGLTYLRISSCYEALGDETRAWSALLDAERFQEFLSREVRELEIPARRAAASLRRGDEAQAKKDLQKVDRSFSAVFRPNDPRKEEQARILYSIAQFSTEALTAENFLRRLEAFEGLQSYLWRAAELRASPWSERALEKLEKSYFGYLEWARAYSDPSRKKEMELKRQWMGGLVKTLASLKMRAGESWKPTAKLREIEEKTQQLLWSAQEGTPLTPEAKSRDTLKREGRVISKPFFPAEKGEPPRGRPPGENDPNLKGN